MTLNKQFDGLNYLFYKVLFIPLSFTISLSELFCLVTWKVLEQVWKVDV